MTANWLPTTGKGVMPAKQNEWNIPVPAMSRFEAVLQEADSSHTIRGNPTVQVTIETFLTSRHELCLRIIYVTGNQNDLANKGRQYGVFRSADRE
ncbi:MAG: hypothetical protein LBD29_05210 [Treponema sp.]|jgi:hypothetical protein|nr:hypothetical protein [Treponema sp.]